MEGAIAQQLGKEHLRDNDSVRSLILERKTMSTSSLTVGNIQNVKMIGNRVLLISTNGGQSET